jgi:hypothetical protein
MYIICNLVTLCPCITIYLAIQDELQHQKSGAKEDKKVGTEAKEKVRFNKMQKNKVFIYFHIVYIFLNLTFFVVVG